jgi:hypothetical protein
LKIKTIVYLAVIAIAICISLSWFWPVHKANIFLREISKFKPGMTDAAQVESLANTGLIKRVSAGCVAGFENPRNKPPAISGISGNSDVCYSFTFQNTIPRILRLAPATGVYGTLTVNNAQLALVRLSVQRKWLFFNISDQACDSCSPNHSDYFVDKHLSGSLGIPGNAHVYLTSKSSQQQRRDAYAINTAILAEMGKNKNGRDLNSAIWSNSH